MIVFTGHQVDPPGRTEPRFPPGKESLAKGAIREAVQQELARWGRAVGMAGAASGGDILFHEVCAELEMPTRLYLALTADVYVMGSVAPAGPDWVRRFWALVSRLPSAPVLARAREDSSIWQRNNLWILEEALADGAGSVTLIALWNGKPGDAPGGTADMIESAQARGAETRILDSNLIFGLQ